MKKKEKTVFKSLRALVRDKTNRRFCLAGYTVSGEHAVFVIANEFELGNYGN